eukprot:scaffold9465_cov45-Attheya_sp.AAC.1
MGHKRRVCSSSRSSCPQLCLTGTYKVLPNTFRPRRQYTQCACCCCCFVQRGSRSRYCVCGDDGSGGVLCDEESGIVNVGQVHVGNFQNSFGTWRMSNDAAQSSGTGGSVLQHIHFVAHHAIATQERILQPSPRKFQQMVDKLLLTLLTDATSSRRAHQFAIHLHGRGHTFHRIQLCGQGRPQVIFKFIPFPAMIQMKRGRKAPKRVIFLLGRPKHVSTHEHVKGIFAVDFRLKVMGCRLFE